jgi:hypothetical protein
MNLRAYARGKECRVRLPGICNFNPETTVLAHVRIVGISGMGIKAPDALGAHCCSACHAACDTDDRHELDFLRGVVRTQAYLIKQGVTLW